MKGIVSIIGWIGIIIFCLSSAAAAGPNSGAGCTLDLDIRTSSYDLNISQKDIESYREVQSGDIVQVGVVAQQVTDLDAYQVMIEYDPQQLEWMPDYNETYDHFLVSNGGKALFMPEIEKTAGEITVAAALIGNDLQEAPDGAGIIGHLTFKVLDISDKTTLQVSYADYLDSTGFHDAITQLGNATLALADSDSTPPSGKMSSAYDDQKASPLIILTFTEPVHGLEPSDIIVVGVESFYIETIEESIYHIYLTPNGEENVEVIIPENAVSDVSGNGNLPCKFENHPPEISGVPETIVEVDSIYRFQPAASDDDIGERLTFDIENQPPWADFDPATGIIDGIPHAIDAGTTSDITISVTDMMGARTSLPSFDLTVTSANDPPYPPVLISPEDGSIDVSLTPTLRTAGFSDPDPDDIHQETQWQISIVSDFSEPILDEIDYFHLIEFPVPENYLEPDSTYFWRVRYRDNHGEVSEWSNIFSFQTIKSTSRSNTDDSRSSSEQGDSGGGGCFIISIFP